MSSTGTAAESRKQVKGQRLVGRLLGMAKLSGLIKHTERPRKEAQKKRAEKAGGESLDFQRRQTGKQAKRERHSCG